MRKYNPVNSKVFIDETGKVSFTTQSIQEARITIHNAMFNFMNKEIKQLMKKHDAYVNKGESDKTYTTISTPSPDFDKDYTALMKKNKKKIIQHFKIESVEEEVQEEGPCWPGYKQVGTKMKNGKQVPNCVPVSEAESLEKELGLELDEAPLVMSDMDMVKAILGKIEDDISKLSMKKQMEKAWPKVQSLAKMAGYKVTKTAQAKGRIFRSDIKK